MNERHRLADRCGSITFNVEAFSLRFTVTASCFDDAALAEIFIQNHKADSGAGIMASDSAIAASLALQYGCPAGVLRKALSRNPRGSATGPLGAALDVLSRLPPADDAATPALPPPLPCGPASSAGAVDRGCNIGTGAMSALPEAWRRPDHPPAPIDALTAKARQVAFLFQNGWLELPEAVDRYQRYAERSGAVTELGSDLVQDLLAAEFEKIPREADELACLYDEIIGDEVAISCDACGAAPCGNPGFCAACREVDRRLAASGRSKEPEPRSTPQVVVEAIMHAVRERGIEALSEPSTLERLGRCDDASLAEIDRRTSQFLVTVDAS